MRVLLLKEPLAISDFHLNPQRADDPVAQREREGEKDLVLFSFNSTRPRIYLWFNIK
jgi:hypothetical protein